MQARLGGGQKAKKVKSKRKDGKAYKFRSNEGEGETETFDLVKMFPTVKEGSRIEQEFDPDMAGLNCIQL